MTQYSTAKICLNGHIITDSMQTNPDNGVDFCTLCGEKTIFRCPECSVSIQGAKFSINRHNQLQRCEGLRYAPAYCAKCGKPYPWTKNKITTAIQIFAEFGNLSDEEKKTIEQDINNIVKDIPQAEISAMRIKRIWGKYGKTAYNVIMEFASKTAAEILKNP